MSQPSSFEQRVEILMSAYASQAPTDVDPLAMARLATGGGRRGSSPVAFPWGDRRLGVLLLVAGVLAAMVIGLLVAGAVPHHRYRDVFEPLGDLSRPALGAARLRDGRVVVVEEGGVFQSYDPRIGRILPGATLRDPGEIGDHAGSWEGIVLTDGRILQPSLRGIGGPGDPGQDGGRFALVDPGVGSVLLTEPDAARAGAALVVLGDGRVLVVGSRAEVFDPATGVFTPTGPLEGMRQGMQATPLADGRVLVFGSSVETDPLGRGGRAADRAAIFDPANGTFTPTGPLVDPGRERGRFTATLLPDGRVLVVGGYGWLAPNAELFDPASGTFSVAGTTANPRIDHAAALLDDGRVLLVGGMSRPYPIGHDDSAEVFDPATGRSRLTATLSEGRSVSSAVRLPDGGVLVVGGTVAEVYR